MVTVLPLVHTLLVLCCLGLALLALILLSVRVVIALPFRPRRIAVGWSL